MKANEPERLIKIEIIDDLAWEPDEDFVIELLDEVSQRRLDGDDTQCTVTIIDEDKPGSLGFSEAVIDVRRVDQVVYVKVERTNGSDGEISCLVTTKANVEEGQGKQAAIEHKDFIPIE